MAAEPSSSFSSLQLTMVPPASDKSWCVREIDINQAPPDAPPLTVAVAEEEEVDDGTPRKKLRLSKEQYELLEESFREHQTVTPKQKEELALLLKLKPRQVEVWFQNRRARTKLKQTELECEYLKRCFGSLTEENKRLQREVEQLRALRMAPLDDGQPLPAPSITMCPHCERITATTTTIITTAAAAATELLASFSACREKTSAAL